MTSYFGRHQRKTAFILLSILVVQLVAPLKGFALTSGPSQPEMTGFQSIGTSDMVDLFSGDFKYNIPLIDVGGYPINLAYSAGAGVEDEASWVGAGWTLNPGTVNRQMKALPDDFKGDVVGKDIYMKPKVRIGVAAEFKPDVFGWEVSGKGKKKKVKQKKREDGKKGKYGVFGLKLSLYKDNYYGWSAGVGTNASLELSTSGGGNLTTDLGISSSSRDGAGISPGINLSYKNTANKITDQVGVSLGFDYNSRQGMQSQSLGISYNRSKQRTTQKNGKEEATGRSSSMPAGINFVDNGFMTYTPTIDVPRKTQAGTMSFHWGAEVFGFKGEIGIDGSYSVESIPDRLQRRGVPAYGYLYAHENLNDRQSEALVDMNREKDIPYFKGTPVIPIPILTNDNFVVTSQNGSGQFKLMRTGSGIGHDSYSKTVAGSTTLGVDIGTGNIINLGGHVYRNEVHTVTKKWLNNNFYAASGDYKSPDFDNPLKQHAYFKRVGELTESDVNRKKSLGGDDAVRIKTGKGSIASSPSASQILLNNSGGAYGAAQIESTIRDKRNNVLSYLSATEAMRYGLDKKIYSYQPVSYNGASCTSIYNRDEISRVTTDRKSHHISEITVLDNQGVKMIYGIPVYNMHQEEVTFNVASGSDASGLTTYDATDTSHLNRKGRDHYFSRDVIPAYATSFLLTGILSPDYRDIKGDGITDDDYGNAVKFNYTKLPDLYKWRTPYNTGKANYNKGLYADDKDDKGNYTYGEKEIWYMHSIESKTLVAVFYLNDDSDVEKQRKDGYGVDNTYGNPGTMRLRRLDSIALYSKPDLKLNGAAATPIKVVHFEYDYSIGSNPGGSSYPNSVAPGGGKLTLKKVFFTYGKNSKGESEPYVFNYKLGYGNVANAAYAQLSSDRWGNYKAPTTAPDLTNGEFPYTDQGNITNEYAALWNLEKIRLPSGGEIRVTYESDDYAYVQDKRACRMFKVATFEGSDFAHADAIIVRSDQNLNAKERELLISGQRYLYGKFYMKLRSKSGGDVMDYVPGYAEIPTGATVTEATGFSIPSGEYWYRIPIKRVAAEGVNGQMLNPFVIGAWQFLRNNLPQYAYPGYEDGTAGVPDVGGNFVGAVKALGNSILNLKELFENYNNKFYRLGYANEFNPGQSWVRLTEPSCARKGGGHRVKKISINDNWNAMTSYESNEYGQMYSYAMEEDGKLISSGVASYEPAIGSDENPFKQPISYSKKVKWGLDYNTYVEQPIGESYMPGPTIGYRKVTVKSFGASNASGASSEDKIGYTENEFYTAKEFPTLIQKTGPTALSYDPKLILSLVVNLSRSHLVTTQGVRVIQNDMHGKPKSVKTYDKGKYLLSSVEYTYKTKEQTAVNELSNEVELLRQNGKVEKGTIGEDVEFYTDMREQHTINAGLRVGVYAGTGSFLIVLPFGGINIGGNASYVSFNSASAIKVISRYGLLVKTTKMENGSTASTENLAWDGETGEVLLSKTNNEFEAPVYNLSYPAHWVYQGMGPAYENAETIITGLATDNGGAISCTASKLSMLREGDELIDLTGNDVYWVIADDVNPSVKYLIDKTGKLRRNLADRTLKVYRSGLRNLAATGVASIMSLRNPVVNGVIDVSTNTQVLDAKAVVYSEEWGVPVANVFTLQENPQTCIGCDCFKKFLFAAMGTKVSGKPGLLAGLTDGESAGSFMQRREPSGSGNCFSNFYNNETAFENSYYLSTYNQYNYTLNSTTGEYHFKIKQGDVAYLGGKKMTYTLVDPQFNNLMNNPAGTDAIWSELFGSCKYRLTAQWVETGCIYKLYYDPTCIGEYESQCGEDLEKPGVIQLLEVFMENGRQYGYTCADPVQNNAINPFFIGIKGTWKPLQSYVYQVNRVNTVPGVSTVTSNIARDGYYSSFDPLITFGLNGIVMPFNGLNSDRWVWSQKSKYYSTRGEELESEDALHRYTSALFGYKQTLPVAVAKNARHLAINYDGFEDYYYDNNGLPTGNCNTEPCGLYKQNGFYIRNKTFSSSLHLDNTVSHSGKYSLKMAGNTTLTLFTNLNNDRYSSLDNNAIVSRNSNKEFVLNNNYLGRGFTPEANKDYILSFWVKDPKTSTPEFAPKVQLSVNGLTQTLTTQKWPFVEGWKRVEVRFNSGTSTDLNVALTATANINIDDIRVFPADAQIKTFAYDAITQRLMAELDENNFATFYEYNDEGTLIRVKKETERGIMTIKESRQYIIKYN